MWSEKHLHQLAYYPTTPYWDTVGMAVKKMAKALETLKVAKVVLNGTEPEARLLYCQMSMLGGQPVPPTEAWPSLRVEPLGYLRPEVQKVVTRGPLAAVMNLCEEHRDAHRGRPLSKKDKQIGRQDKHRPRARMNHCALVKVLYYALCGLPCGRLGELTEFPMMIRVMDGYEVFGPLQLKRIYWSKRCSMRRKS